MLPVFESIKYQIFKNRLSEQSLLWWLAAGISITIVWLPILNAILCVAFIVLRAYQVRFRFRIHRISMVVLFASFYVITAFSVLYSDNQPEAIRILQLKLPLFIFPFVFASGVDWDKKMIRLLLLLFSWSVALFCFLVIGNAIVKATTSGSIQALFGYSILPLKYVYASIASLFCVFGSAIHLNEIAEKRKLTIVHLIPLLLFWTTLILISNRMGIFLCVIITLFFLLRLVQSAAIKSLTVVFIFFVLIGLYSWNQTFQQKIKALVQVDAQQTIQLDEESSLGRTWDGLHLRLAIWDCATDVIKRHPLAGVGVGDAQQTLQEAYENRKFYFASRHNTYNAHNQFLEQWLMTGIVGCLLFILALAIPLILSLKNDKLLYSLFLIIFICFCLTESVLEVTKGVVWFSFFNSIFAFQKN